jgi:hypothetical protein
MTPVVWIALAYGVVAVTLLTYTIALRRRLNRGGQARNLTRPGASLR